VNRLESHLKRKIPCKPTPVKLEVMRISTDGNGKITIRHRPPIDRFPCHYCHKEFTRKDNLTAHLKKNRCLFMKSQTDVDQVENKNNINIDQLKAELKAELRAEFEEKSQVLEKQSQILEKKSQVLEKKIAELSEKPLITNQILQVVCVGNNDNYLDMLTKEFNDCDKAIEYIKDCALSHIRGDCKLIKGKPLSNPYDVFEGV
jgi:DNA-binding transcriptional MerR regulator